MAPSTVPTRIMMISDTHEYEFDGSNMQEVDVLLHCGDMTHVGGTGAYKRSLRMMETIKAELKLVIAGNHDNSLDKYWRMQTQVDDEEVSEEAFQTEEEYQKDYEDAFEVMTGPLSKECGITYLEEGTHMFKLRNGARFSVYASPYTPEFCNWGFSYKPHEDRFNTIKQTAPGRTSIATRPIPSFPEVHILMTHGPPHMILDKCDNGNVGCDNLLRAAGRAKPLLHCFGHIHESRGANLVTWNVDGSVKDLKNAAPGEAEQNNCQDVKKHPVIFGAETLMVNAAVMDGHMQPNNAPFTVVLDLPCQ